MMQSFAALSTHASLTRALYRELLRGLNNIKSVVPIIDADNENKMVQRELTRAQQNPELYGKFLSSEIRYYVDEEFRRDRKRTNEKSLHLTLVEGTQLIDALAEVHRDPHTNHGWTKVIELLVKHRDAEFTRQRWVSEYHKNRDAIDEVRNKGSHPLIKKQKESRAQLKTARDPKFSMLSSSGQHKAYKKALEDSKENADFVVRNYIKKLQLEGRIPNPYKLPYVSDSISKQAINMPDPSKLLPGSTKHSVMKEAYDMEYIDAIVKPEIEFLINQAHYLDPLRKRMNEKGPYKVKIRHTNAGAMTAHFIKLPYTREKEMKEIAMDIKELMRAIRKQFIWNLDPKTSGAKLSEKKIGDGFAVRGSGGFSPEEVMFPRYYHEKLAQDEAEWEYKMETLLNENQGPETEGKLAKLRRALHASWRAPLEESTAAIDHEILLLYKKYKVDRQHPIFDDQAHFQREMNEFHEKKAHAYEELLQVLKEDNVFLHSDLVNKDVVKVLYDDCMKNEEKKKEKHRHGVAELERKGMGKRLGDYLESHGFRSYKMGYRFAKRFGF